MNEPLRRPARRRVALLGCLAILLQAILFGWHHHELALPSHGAPPAAYAEGGTPLSPATAEDDCDICQALHHLRAAPGEVALLPLPGGGASPLASLKLPRRGGAQSAPFRRARHLGFETTASTVIQPLQCGGSPFIRGARCFPLSSGVGAVRPR